MIYELHDHWESYSIDAPNTEIACVCAQMLSMEFIHDGKIVLPREGRDDRWYKKTFGKIRAEIIDGTPSIVIQNALLSIKADSGELSSIGRLLMTEIQIRARKFSK